jgi:hypothetical protein
LAGGFEISNSKINELDLTFGYLHTDIKNGREL